MTAWTNASSACAPNLMPATSTTPTWQQVKLLYIGLLLNHKQPELAETFFNSVTTKILHRNYFHNDFIFVRPTVSTENIEADNDHARPTAATTPRKTACAAPSADRH
jgi:isocitrate dehydrogenase kinase/phosphatase